MASTFFRNGFTFPTSAYLVFIWGKEKWIVKSRDVEYQDSKKDEFKIPKSLDVDLCDVTNMSLKVNGKLVNNVRWFNVSRLEDGKYKVESKYKSCPKVSLFKYLGSLLPILGCFFLYGKNNRLRQAIDNLDQAQSDLSEIYKYSDSGEEELKWSFPSKHELNIAKELQSKYGSWKSIKEQLINPQSLNDKHECELLRKKLDRLGEENFEVAIGLIDEYGKLEKVKDRLINHENMNSKISSLGFDLDGLVSFQQDYGSFFRIKEQLENFSDLTKNYGSTSQIKESLRQGRELKKSFDDLKNKVNLLGSDQSFQCALDLHNNYGSFETIKQRIQKWEETAQQNILLTNKVTHLETERLPELENTLKAIGNSADIESILELKKIGSYGAIYEFVKEQKIMKPKIDSLEVGLDSLIDLKKDYGSFFRIKEQLENFSDLTKNYGSTSQIKESLRQGRELKKSFDDLKNKVNLLGSDQSFQCALDLHNNYGSFETIKQRIQKWEEIEHKHILLEAKNKELLETDKRWNELYDGKYTLEQLEERKKMKENANRISEGNQFEERIKDMLDDVSADDYSTDDSFNVTPEYLLPGTQKPVDFWIQLKNEKHKSEFSVAVECKWSEYDESFILDSTSEKKNINQVSVGLEQLCKYCDLGDANLGILVINSNVYDIERKKIKMIKSKELPQKYQDKRMNILLVHESVLGAVAYIIKLIHANYIPNDLKTVFTITDKSESYALHKMQEIFKDLQTFNNISPLNYEKLTKKINAAIKQLTSSLKTFEVSKKELENLTNKISNHINEYESYTPHADNLLEGSILPSVEEEAEEN